MPDLFELAAQARTLAVDVEALNRTNAGLAQTVAENTALQERQGRRIDRAEGLITRTWLIGAALLLLAALLAVITFRQVVSEDRLNQVVTAEHVARQKGQCPLLALFISSYNPDRRQPGTSREEYESAFAVIRSSYADLQCDDPTVPGGRATNPPVTPTPTP